MSKIFFDHLNQVIKDKKPNYWKSLSDVDKKTWNTFMMNRYLSMNPEWIVIVDLFQKYNHTLDDELCYIVYANYIPKGKQFLRYIKRDKDGTNKELIKYISEYYECSLKEAEDYMGILSKEELEIMLDQFGLEKRTITKLLKGK